ncbi:hypothetical protein F0562_032124 [Nyssa sinensis]|uniref:Leucine-rich repeat-containing N-terminal plant-type domain-containing protein n=1 Tax=Nyssa sinensis TaxID=561372 RepID=A0A5J5AYQ2_9ASTE|nr:hypothetical protein F0562_032124 [Nyssa sinensis]
MKYHKFVSLLLLLLSDLTVIAGCHGDEREALFHFKSLLSDPSNRLASWQGQNCCNWHGIRCSGSQHVIAVDLQNPNRDSFILNSNSRIVSTSNSTYTALEGTISPALFTLTHLRYLDLSFNNFMFSKIPSGMSNLTSLTYINLGNAMFKDSITNQFSNLTSLRQLDVSCSYKIADASSISYNLTSLRAYAGPLTTHIYSGNISSSTLNWLSGLHNLRELKLDGVDLSEASHLNKWAEPISVLSNLRLIHLYNCKIRGEIPIYELLNLTQLYSLKMDYNVLTSPIPSQLANLTSISILDLSHSTLQGSVPYLPQLQELYVGDNPGITIDLRSMFGVPWAHLETLSIQSTQVTGPIPASFANSSSLIYFSAYSCSIEGPMPSSLYNLSKLEVLNLNFNYITGHLSPSISNLQSLQYLSLFENSLEGPIPDSICEISSLQYVHLASNALTGRLPNCIGRLTNLTVFIINGNNLNGTIPSLTSLFQNSTPSMIMLGSSGLTVKAGKHPFPSNFQLQTLELNSCNMGGGIPDFVSYLTQIEFLSLANNSLSGKIPTWLFNLPKLGYLDLSFNILHGVIPPIIQLQSFYGPTTLNFASNHLEGPIPLLPETIEVIDLSGNNLTGYIPTQAGGLQNIKYLTFSGNMLSGPIPLSFCHENNVLMHLDLSNNSLSGTLPPSLGNCTSLISLNLGMNNLRGNIPNELEAAKKMTYLQLNDNHFNGHFPSFIRGLQSLEVLNLGNNRFQGEIPQFIGNLQNLRILVLELNTFNGSIPREIKDLRNLQFIDLSRNNLFGAIPDELHGLKMLTSRPDRSIIGRVISSMYSGVELSIVSKGSSYELEVVFSDMSGIDLSCNSLTGNIPQEIGLLQGLYMLNLSRNSLSGEIPMSIGKMRGLDSISSPGPEPVDADEDASQILFYVIVMIGYGVGLWGFFIVLYLMKGRWRERYWRVIDKIVLRIIQCM